MDVRELFHLQTTLSRHTLADTLSKEQNSVFIFSHFQLLGHSRREWVDCVQRDLEVL